MTRMLLVFGLAGLAYWLGLVHMIAVIWAELPDWPVSP
jgi:hypothetical protein